PLLHAVAGDRQRGRDEAEIARAFHAAVAQGVCDAATALSRLNQVDTVVLSGGVFQNGLLSAEVQSLLAAQRLAVWVNHVVPPNDGGISLGQAAMAALARSTAVRTTTEPARGELVEPRASRSSFDRLRTSEWTEASDAR